MYVYEESDRGILPRNRSNNDGKLSAESEEGRLRIKENTLPSNTYPTLCGVFCVSHGWASVRTSAELGRYSSAIRAACANQRSCGSVRGAISDGRPYRDRQSSKEPGMQDELRTLHASTFDPERDQEAKSPYRALARLLGSYRSK